MTIGLLSFWQRTSCWDRAFPLLSAARIDFVLTSKTLERQRYPVVHGVNPTVLHQTKSTHAPHIMTL